MIHGTPEIVGLAVDLHVDLIQMPTPLSDLAELLRPTFPDLAGEHRTKSVPPVPDCLVADFDSALVQQVFYVSKRERKADIHHYSEPNDLGRRFEIAEGGLGHAGQSRAVSYPLSSEVLLTTPSKI